MTLQTRILALALCTLSAKGQISITNGDIAFFLPDQNARLDFISADNACREANSSFGLAQVTNQAEFNVLTNIFDAVLTVDSWIGFVDLQQSSSVDTSRFSFTDGSRDSNVFFEDAGVFPWLPGEPNNQNGNQHCIKTSSSGWSDADCSDQLGFWCSVFRSGIVTSATPTTTQPTGSPSIRPTSAPSANPTFTRGPTAQEEEEVDNPSVEEEGPIGKILLGLIGVAFFVLIALIAGLLWKQQMLREHEAIFQL